MLEALSLLDSMLCWSARLFLTSGQNVSRGQEGSLKPGTSLASANTAKGSHALATFFLTLLPPPRNPTSPTPAPKATVMVCLQREESKQDRT